VRICFRLHRGSRRESAAAQLAALFTGPAWNIFDMNYDALTPLTLGFCFPGMGLLARKKNPTSKWKAFVIGGAVLVVAGALALCFGWET
jgi:hypothetical protein